MKGEFEMELSVRLENMREFFNDGWTLDVAYRKEALMRLKNVIKKYEYDVMDALYEDLGKSDTESYATEIGLVYEEITYMLKHMDKLAKPRYVSTPLTNFLSTSKIIKEPYGTALIMAPWNYPFQLCMVPLIGAVAAGNCAVVKPSNYAPHVAEVVDDIIYEAFDDEHVFVVIGGREANQDLLSHKFDYIFFTGGKAVGRTVMHAASDFLTPVTLELGGKSPCIVDSTADIALTARRIVWGKFLNCGQTCVAPDYVYVHKKVKEQLMEAIVRNIEALYGEEPLNSKDYGKIINEKHFNRLSAMLDGADIYYGGETDHERNKIAPTVIDNADWSIPAMQEEIFGPVLPVLEYENLNDVIREIKKRPKPLALYMFTRSKENERKVLKNVSFGGGCINDTVMHLATTSMPFGGVGESGMGNYHGKYSFRTFSHEKSILNKSLLIDMPMRYAPYGDNMISILRLFLH